MKTAEEYGKAGAGDVVFRTAQNLREGRRFDRDTDAVRPEIQIALMSCHSVFLEEFCHHSA